MALADLCATHFRQCWEQTFIMQILREVFLKMISSFPMVPPENGGILGMKDDIVCEYLHDYSKQTNEAAKFVPDVQWMNQIIYDWNKKGVLFGGIVHSHPIGQESLSFDDIRYITSIMDAMPSSVSKLYFPVVIPGHAVFIYLASKSGISLRICQENVELI